MYAIVVQEYFPPQEAGMRVGVVVGATLLGMALGGWMSGTIFDLTHSYRATFVNGVLWNLLNLSIVLWNVRDLARQHQYLLAINLMVAVAVGNRCSRKAVECRRHRSVGHRPASRHPARARPEVPRRRTGSPRLRSQSGDSAAAVAHPCACP